MLRGVLESPESLCGEVRYNERDPIIGRQEEGTTLTIPKEPVRRRILRVQTFKVLRGGDYFIMPSLSALRWIGSLAETNPTEQKER